MLKTIHKKEESAFKKAKADMKKEGIKFISMIQENQILKFTQQTFAY